MILILNLDKLRPNTEFHWNSEEGVEELRAARDIRQGEELTDSYLDLTVQVKNKCSDSFSPFYRPTDQPPDLRK